MGRDIAAVKGCEREMARLQKEVEHADAAREELRESFMAIQRYEVRGSARARAVRCLVLMMVNGGVRRRWRR